MKNQTMPLTQEQISQYHQDGYLIAPNIFDIEELEPLLTACENDPEIWKAESPYRMSNGKLNRIMFYAHLSESLLGVLPRLARIVDRVEALLDEECYHFHSKLVRKEAYNQGNVDWHQGYGTWYHYGCLFPTQVTCAMAITENTKANGCMQVIKKSHQMGRLNHLQVGDTDAADRERMQEVLKQLEVVDCEMQAGDVLFFHANTLHASTPNNTDKIRVILHSTYSTISGQPYKKDWQHHAYKPLEKLPNSVIKEGKYDGIFNQNDFFQENDKEQASGLVFRGFQEAQ
ncbi:phytanoyl-CoA dioxygenase family protein [Spirulina sp. CS-785/01]|uniref:phytanoyl-CoA dioxygenase family protein n=1 Tax=Spirulina sp. CS-785/01 TaxID=3021716 RepID=UPI00232BACDC|nr:phytanoyl-CoA dioxygenase family protein [Spirulina sp. CS-785/01]MDB9314635.1 phytanoyl-CoA dioxygenase family protein [Spirulina sp. CS-785/01]